MDTDVHITRLCAEAMGLVRPGATEESFTAWASGIATGEKYDPLHDDAQCMALAKAFPHYALAAFASMCGDMIDRGALTGCGYDVNYKICRLVAAWREFAGPTQKPPCQRGTG